MVWFEKGFSIRALAHRGLGEFGDRHLQWEQFVWRVEMT